MIDCKVWIASQVDRVVLARKPVICTSKECKGCSAQEALYPWSLRTSTLIDKDFRKKKICSAVSAKPEKRGFFECSIKMGGLFTNV